MTTEDQAAETKQDEVSEPSVSKPQDVSPQISVIIPAFNEQGNVTRLHGRLISSLTGLNRSYEIIFVDDGSTDRTSQELLALATVHRNVKVIQLSRNFGQTAAIAAGIDYAAGKVLVTLDADLQNDPADIALLMAKLDTGFDVVSGWRLSRRDPYLRRVLPSMVANKLISIISGIRLHDYGCSLKAYRREVLKDVRLYGEMHGFIAIYASWMGAAVAEIPVNHYPRAAGVSKYGPTRSLKVVLDLLTVKFLFDYGTKPSYVFGTLGLLSMMASVLVFAWAVVLKYFYKTSFILTPLPLLAALLFMVGLQFILMGLLAEMLVRTYHESQNKPIYMIKSTLNC